jgi:hypothetical protein
MAKRGQIELEKVELAPVEVPQYVRACGVEGCPYGGKININPSYGGSVGQEHTHYRYGDYEFAVLPREKIEEYDGPLFKWVDEQGRSAWGGNMQWDLPKDGQPGDWAEPDKKLLSTCQHGLHALLPGQRGFGGAGRLFVAESRGPVMFTHGKVVCMNLRLVREVDLDGIVTPEIEDAHWKDLAKRMQTPSEDWITNYSWVPKKYHHLIRKTRNATLTAVRKEARPLLTELDRLSVAMSKWDTTDWHRLRGQKAPTLSDWQPFFELKKQRTKVRRQLKNLDNIVAQAQRKPTWNELPGSVLDAYPDVKLYRSEEPKWQDS